MKKLVFLLLTLIVPLLFFSFLTTAKRDREDEIYLFFDRELPNHRIITGKLIQELENLGYRVRIDQFEYDEIDAYLIANPQALFLTEKDLESELFVLQRIPIVDVKVPIIHPSQELVDIDEDQLEGLVFDASLSDADIIRRTVRNRLPIGVVSFESLNLQVRPLPVNGISPTLDHIERGEYPWILRANLYMRIGSPFTGHDQLREICGGWIDSAFTLIAGGDIMLARGTGQFLEQFGPRYPFLEIRDEILKHDISFANLESPLSSRGSRYQPNKGIYFRADPTAVEGLVFGGFDVLSLGNNHALDWSAPAIRDTMTLLEMNGIAFSGLGETWEDAFKPAVIEIRGTRVAILSINDIYPFEVYGGNAETMLTLTYDEQRLSREIRKLREKCDIIIASVHTGVEYAPHPEPSKVIMMRSLIDSGIDVVLGTHPHVIQDIEVYGDGLIAYSLGNLIFDQSWSMATSMGLLLEIGFLDGRPIYYNPQVVYIQNAQARILYDEESKAVIHRITAFNKGDIYVKN
jgi:poly-gamma-glutamate capsule biosynthesis protein CapA/YwtB (metallophosphatase superfamily)